MGRAEAHRFDAEDRPTEAITAYEAFIRSPVAALEDYLNLAVLYLTCTDLGFASGHHIPREIERNSFEKAKKTLLEAELRFGRTPDVEFWQLYLP